MRRLAAVILATLPLTVGARAQVPIQPNTLPLVTQTARGAVPPSTPAGTVFSSSVGTPMWVGQLRSMDESGAAGDGVTDDTAKVNAFLATLTHGGTVFMPPGKAYRIISGNLVVPPGVWLLGAGPAASKIDATTLTAPSTIILCSTCSIISSSERIGLSHLLIYADGMVPNPSTAQAQAWVAAMSTSKSVGINITNVAPAGGADDSQFEDLLIMGFGTGINGNPSARWTASNLWLDDYVGIDFGSSGDYTSMRNLRCEPFYTLATDSTQGTWARPGVCIYLHDGAGLLLQDYFSFMFANSFIVSASSLTLTGAGFEWASASNINNGILGTVGLRAVNHGGIRIDNVNANGVWQTDYSFEGPGVEQVSTVYGGAPTAQMFYLAGSSAPTQVLTIGGTIAAGNTVSETITDAAQSWSPLTVTVTASAGDTPNTLAVALQKAILLNQPLVGSRFYAGHLATNTLTTSFPATETVTVTAASTGAITTSVAAGGAQNGSYGIINNINAVNTAVPIITAGDSASQTLAWVISDVFNSGQGLQQNWLQLGSAAENKFLSVSQPLPYPNFANGAPLTSCGSGAVINGNQSRGTITYGTGTVTACVVNFGANAYWAVPSSVQVTTNSTTIAASITNLTTSGFTINLPTNLPGGTVYYNVTM